MPLQLELQPRFKEVNRRNAVLDADYCVVKRSNFDLVETQEQLTRSHDIITETFKISVTDHAREEWA